jgi:hypothetical protein
MFIAKFPFLNEQNQSSRREKEKNPDYRSSSVRLFMKEFSTLLCGRWWEHYFHLGSHDVLPHPDALALAGEAHYEMETQIGSALLAEHHWSHWDLTPPSYFIELHSDGTYQSALKEKREFVVPVHGRWELEERGELWVVRLYPDNHAIEGLPPLRKLWFDGLHLYTNNAGQMHALQAEAGRFALEEWSQEEALSWLRHWLSKGPSLPVWKVLCRSLEAWEGQPYWPMLLHYTQQHLEEWPLELCKAPWGWVLSHQFPSERMKAFPSLRLARSLEVRVAPEEHHFLTPLARSRELKPLKALSLVAYEWDAELWKAVDQGVWADSLTHLTLKTDKLGTMQLLQGLLKQDSSLYRGLERLTLVLEEALSPDWKQRLLLSPLFSDSVRQHWRKEWVEEESEGTIY